MSETAVIPADGGEKKSLDDVMLAMDIVDTLRHREKLIDRELSTEEREKRLIARLKEIYAAQGIDVPERILADGVKALEEKRFVYEPPKDTLAVRFAKFYIARDRWLKPVAAILGVAAFATAVWEIGYDGPRERRENALRVEISQTLPANLAAARDEALAVASVDAARTRIETAYQDGAAAAAAEDADAVRAAIRELDRIEASLAQALDIRIISRPGEFSGVFRTHDNDADLRNYYLIVEAVDAAGRAQRVDIASEEDQRRDWAESWGVRVPEGVFNRVAADKQDDQIIQNAIVGAKPAGALTPQYSIETMGGEILEW